MRNWLKRRGEALLDEIVGHIVTGLVSGLVLSLIIAGGVAVVLVAWALLTSPTAPAIATVAIGGFGATLLALRQVSALIVERRPKPPPRRGSKYISPGLEDDFVLSSGVAWQWNEAVRNIEGPLCPRRGHVIALDYEGVEDITPLRPLGLGEAEENAPRTLEPPGPFSFREPSQGVPQEVRRAPLEDDRVGLGAGKLVCPKGQEEFRLGSFDLSGRGKTIGEARKLALKEYQAKVRQRQLIKLSVPDTEEPPRQ